MISIVMVSSLTLVWMIQCRLVKKTASSPTVPLSAVDDAARHPPVRMDCSTAPNRMTRVESYDPHQHDHADRVEKVYALWSEDENDANSQIQIVE